MAVHQYDFEYLIVGAGKTGQSVADYLSSKNINFAIIDDRKNPPSAEYLQKTYPKIPQQFGSFNSQWTAKNLVLSPGIPPENFIDSYKNKAIIGDIELFARENTKKVIAITGTNGKSTITELLEFAFVQAGIKAVKGGNIGTPVLELLADNNIEVIILELSSFQLQTTTSLISEVALILNITPDHLDRHKNMLQYQSIKQSIFNAAKNIVINLEDKSTQPIAVKNQLITAITTNQPNENQWGIVKDSSGQDIIYYGYLPILPIDKIKLIGKHNLYNFLTALAVSNIFKIPVHNILLGLLSFNGLDHRMQLVAKHNSISYINDSKATNVGATKAAILSLAYNKNQTNIIILIGGDSKQADFSILIPTLAKYIKHTVIFGRDADKISAQLDKYKTNEPIVYSKCKTMADAIKIAIDKEVAGDTLLLSPACASLDEFKNFEQRGQTFVKIINQHIKNSRA